MNNSALRALYDNLKQYAEKTLRENPATYAGMLPEDATAQLAAKIDNAIRNVKKAGWRGNRFKEKEVRIAIKNVLDDTALVDSIFEIVKHQRDY
jgi:type I restriction enzyme R subunit